MCSAVYFKTCLYAQLKGVNASLARIYAPDNVPLLPRSTLSDIFLKKYFSVMSYCYGGSPFSAPVAIPQWHPA